MLGIHIREGKAQLSESGRCSFICCLVRLPTLALPERHVRIHCIERMHDLIESVELHKSCRYGPLRLAESQNVAPHFGSLSSSRSPHQH